MQSLTFITFIVSEKTATLKLQRHPAGQTLTITWAQQIGCRHIAARSGLLLVTRRKLS